MLVMDDDNPIELDLCPVVARWDHGELPKIDLQIDPINLDLDGPPYIHLALTDEAMALMWEEHERAIERFDREVEPRLRLALSDPYVFQYR